MDVAKISCKYRLLSQNMDRSMERPISSIVQNIIPGSIWQFPRASPDDFERKASRRYVVKKKPSQAGNEITHAKGKTVGGSKEASKPTTPAHESFVKKIVYKVKTLALYPEVYKWQQMHLNFSRKLRFRQKKKMRCPLTSLFMSKDPLLESFLESALCARLFSFPLHIATFGQ